MYRILTEERNVEKMKAILRSLGLDFTVFRALGSWLGKEEASVAIELDNVAEECAEGAAKSIKSMNGQEAVLFQVIPGSSKLI